MSTPVNAQVDQAGQASGGGNGGLPQWSAKSGTHTTTHARSFIHYVTNGMDADGLSGTVVDEGWQYVPYRTLRASVTPRQLNGLLRGNRAFRVKSMGFSLSHFNPLVEQIANRAGVNTIQTVFENHPFLMMLTDHNLLLDNMLVTKNAKDKKWNTCNTDMTRSMPADQTNGGLPRVVFDLGTEFTDSLNGEAIDKWGTFTTFSDFNISTHSSGEGCSYNWQNSGEGMARWYPTTKYKGYNKLDTLPNIFATDYDIGAVEYNTYTQINRNYTSKPPPVLLRVNPVHGIEGPINIGAQVFVTYFSSIEWHSNSGALLTLNEPTDAPAGPTAWDRVRPPLYNLANPMVNSSWQQEFQYDSKDPSEHATKRRRVQDNPIVRVPLGTDVLYE